MLITQVGLTLPIHQRQWSKLNEWYEGTVALQLIRFPWNLVLAMALLKILCTMYSSTTSVCKAGAKTTHTRTERTCKELLRHCRTEEDDFLQRTVTEDGRWAHYFQSATASKEWRHPNSPKPKKFRAQPSASNVLLTLFWTVRDRFWSIT
jgi:hypothetical protein